MSRQLKPVIFHDEDGCQDKGTFEVRVTGQDKRCKGLSAPASRSSAAFSTSTYASSCCFFSAFSAACSFSSVSGFLTGARLTASTLDAA